MMQPKRLEAEITRLKHRLDRLIEWTIDIGCPIDNGRSQMCLDKADTTPCRECIIAALDLEDTPTERSDEQ